MKNDKVKKSILTSRPPKLGSERQNKAEIMARRRNMYDEIPYVSDKKKVVITRGHISQMLPSKDEILCETETDELPTLPES
jgi:hypothetical protein